MSAREHWEAVYESKAPDQLSWYRPHLELSLQLIDQVGLSKSAQIIDVGGGASTLVDDLLARGFTNVTVLDVSSAALEATRTRLGSNERLVRWVTADVTQASFETGSVDLWHDRAVFHFLRGEDEKRRYVAVMRRAVTPGGYVLMATFGPEGPEHCSGLEVDRYDADTLAAQLGPGFRMIHATTEIHWTPWGIGQQFLYCLFRASAA